MSLGALGSFVASLIGIKEIAVAALWVALFKRRNKTVWRVIVGLIPIAIDVLTGGNKGHLFHGLLMVMFAYQYVRGVSIRKVIAWIPIIAFAIILGFVYGQEWRDTKTSEYGRATVISFASNVAMHRQAVDNLLEHDLGERFSRTFELIGVRASGLVSIGVIIARHEELDGLERMQGIHETIISYILVTYIASHNDGAC